MRKDLLKKIKEVKDNDPSLITITVFAKKKSGKELDTFLFVNNFPYEEFKGTKKMIVKLIDQAQKKQK